MLTERASTKESRGCALVDIGGSRIRVGTLSLQARPVMSVATPRTRDEIVREVARLTEAVAPLRHVIVGCPGLVDTYGRIYKALYIDLEGMRLQAVLMRALGCNVIVVNDANLQALAFASLHKTIMYIVFGTGVGGALISQGALILGANGFAGEIGHLPVPGLRTRCICGRIGCIDAIASGASLARRLGDKWWKQTASKRNKDYMSIVGDNCGRAIGTIASLLDPHLIVAAGHIVGFMPFRRALGAGVRAVSLQHVVFERDTWKLSVRGAHHVLSQKEF